MSANEIQSWQISTPTPEKAQQTVANYGGPQKEVAFRRLRPPGMTGLLTREPGGRLVLDQCLPRQRPPSSAASVQETAF